MMLKKRSTRRRGTKKKVADANDDEDCAQEVTDAKEESVSGKKVVRYGCGISIQK